MKPRRMLTRESVDRTRPNQQPNRAEQHKTKEIEGGGEESEVPTSEDTERSVRGIEEDDRRQAGQEGQSDQRGFPQDETAILETEEDTDADMDFRVEVYLVERVHTKGRNERCAMCPCKGRQTTTEEINANKKQEEGRHATVPDLGSGRVETSTEEVHNGFRQSVELIGGLD